MPEFQDTTSWIKRSSEWTLTNKESLMTGTQQAIVKAIEEHGGAKPDGAQPPQ
jgi:hypothetical protein